VETPEPESLPGTESYRPGLRSWFCIVWHLCRSALPPFNRCKQTSVAQHFLFFAAANKQVSLSTSSFLPLQTNRCRSALPLFCRYKQTSVAQHFLFFAATNKQVSLSTSSFLPLQTSVAQHFLFFAATNKQVSLSTSSFLPLQTNRCRSALLVLHRAGGVEGPLDATELNRTLYDRTFGGFPVKKIVCTPCTWFWPTLPFCD